MDIFCVLQIQKHYHTDIACLVLLGIKAKVAILSV